MAEVLSKSQILSRDYSCSLVYKAYRTLAVFHALLGHDSQALLFNNKVINASIETPFTGNDHKNFQLFSAAIYERAGQLKRASEI